MLVSIVISSIFQIILFSLIPFVFLLITSRKINEFFRIYWHEEHTNKYFDNKLI